MGLFDGIALIVCGALCMPSVIAKKKPEAKELLAKIAQFQGWIGLIICLWGAYGIFRSLTTLGWLGTWPLWWVTNLAASALNLLVGFLLGFGMIQSMLLKNAPDDAKAKAEEMHQKLVGVQIPLGYLAVIVGIWVILYNLVLYNIFHI